MAKSGTGQQSIDPLMAVAASEYAPADVTDQSVCMEEAPWSDAEMTSADLSAIQAAPAEEQTAKPRATLEVAFFGKVHTGITVEEFREKAKDFHATHCHELKVLYSAVCDYRLFFREIYEPDGFADRATALTVEGITAVRNYFSTVSKAPRPDSAEFDRLAEDLENLAQKLSEQDLSYPAVHQMGASLHEVRLKLEDLNRRVAKFQGKALESAEGTTKVLETVEGTSFQLLAIAPKLLGWDPYREAAYKIGLIVARAGARALGGAIAYSSGRKALEEVFQVLKKDVPPLLVEYIMKPFGKFLEGKKVGALSKAVLESSLKVCLGVACELVLTVLDKEEGKKDLTREDFENLMKRAATDAFSEIVGHVMRLPKSDTLVRKAVNSTIEATATVLFDDYLTARQTAKRQNRPVWEVFAGDLPWTILKIVQAAFMGTVNRHVDEKVEQRRKVAESEKAASEKVAEVKALPPAPEYDARSRAVVPKVGPKKPRPPRPPILTDKETEDLWWGKTGLAWEMANGLRQAAWKGNEIIVIRKPSHGVFMYQRTKSYFPKPGSVDAKSAKFGPHAGLVVEPMLGPPSGPTHHIVMETFSDGKPKPAETVAIERRRQHEYYADLKKGWNKALAKAVKAGNLVRDDGVLFHPEMLAYHAKDHPADFQAARRAYKLLMDLNGAGVTKVHADGPDGDAVRAKAESLGYSREQFNEMHALLKRAKVGFFSDIDLAHVVDADSGEVKNMGKGNEIENIEKAKQRLKDAEQGNDAALLDEAKAAYHAAHKELRAVRREQARIDRNMSEERKKDYAPAAGFYDGLTRKKSIKTPHRQALVQHGADRSYVGGKGKGYYAGGDVVMIFPDGSYRVVQSRLHPVTVDANSMHMAETWRRKGKYSEDDIEQMHEKWVDDAHNVDILAQYDEIKKQHLKGVNHKQLYAMDLPREVVPDPTDGVEASGKAPKPDYNKDVAKTPRFKAKDPVGVSRAPVEPGEVEAGIVNRALLTSSKRLSEFARLHSPQRVEEIERKYGAHFAIDAQGKNLLVAVRLDAGRSVAHGLACLAMAHQELTAVHGSDAKVWFELHTQYRPMTTGRVINRIGAPALKKFPDVPRPWLQGATHLVSSFALHKDASRLQAWRGGGVTSLLSPAAKKHDAKTIAVKLADVWEHRKTGTLYRVPVTIKGRPVAVIFSTLAPTPHDIGDAAEETGD